MQLKSSQHLERAAILHRLCAGCLVALRAARRLDRKDGPLPAYTRRVHAPWATAKHQDFP